MTRPTVYLLRMVLFLVLVGGLGAYLLPALRPIFENNPELNGLILAVLLFGIVIGTYSSIYVASPIILLWGAKREDDEARPIAPQPARP